MTIDDDLRHVLIGSTNLSKLDRKLSNSLSIVNQSISFVPGTKPFENETNILKSKYIFVNVKKANTFESIGHDPLKNGNRIVNGFAKPSGDTINPIKCDGPQVPLPQFVIYPEEAVKLTWEDNLRTGTGVGLNNLGNTCFLNSILQVLTNSAPLVNYLFGDHHASNACPLQNGFCAVCTLRTHVKRIRSAAESRTDAMSPQNIVSKLRCVMKNHGFGRQEDAHEFLRYFVDSMQNACLFMFKDKKLDLFTKETSPIGRIFGGYHKNDITCLCCKSVSTTFDPFLDISLEIKKFDNIEQSFRHFTRMETLTGDNAYKCPKCNKKVTAHKSYSIHEAPNILTVQLKRFDHFGKIDKSVSFSEKLNLRPFMSQKQGRPVNYKLYGVVVHSGRSTNSGHYFAFVRNPLDQWHLMDDSRVCVVSPKNVLHSAAYLLFYIRLPVQMAAVRPQPKAVDPQERKQENLLIRNDLNINSPTNIMKNVSQTKNNRAVPSKESNPSGNHNGIRAASTPIVHAVAPLPQFIPRSLISNNNVQRNANSIVDNKTTPVATASQNHTKIKIIYHNSNNNSKFTPRLVNQPTLIADARVNEQTTNGTQNSPVNVTNETDNESSKPNLNGGSCATFDVITNSDTSTLPKPYEAIKGGLLSDVNDCHSKEKMIDANHNVEKRPFDEKDEEDSRRKKKRRKERERKKKHKYDEKRERSSSSYHSKRHSSQSPETSQDKEKTSSTKRRHSPSPSPPPRNTLSSSPPPIPSSTKKRRRDNNDQDCRRRRHRRRSKSPRQSRTPEFYRSRSPTAKISRSEESQERRSVSSSRRSHSNSVKKDEHIAKENQNNEINRESSPPKDNNPDVQDRAVSGRNKSSNDGDHPQMSRKEKKRLKNILRKKRKSECKNIVQTTSQSPVVEKANEKLAELKAPPKKIVIPSPLEFLKTFCKPTIKTWEEKNGGKVTHNPENIFRTNNDDSEKQHSNDLDDDEMDAGKTKKVKKKNFTNNQYRNDKWNPFQYAFDAKMSK